MSERHDQPAAYTGGGSASDRDVGVRVNEDWYLAARRLVLQHDSQFYGPMKGTRCACEFCRWPRRFVKLVDQLEEAGLVR